MNFKKEIKDTLTSGKPIIYVSTEEEDKLEYILNYIIQEIFNQQMFSWNFIDGYTGNPNYSFNSAQNPLEALNIITKHDNNAIKVFFLKDFNLFLKDVGINRKLKNLYKYLQQTNQYLILSGATHDTPIELKEYISHLTMPLPSKKEITIELDRFISNKSIEIKIEEDKKMICMAYAGFSTNRIRESLSQLTTNKLSIKYIIQNILKEKSKLTKKTEGLQFYSTNHDNLEIGGLENLKNWLTIRNSTFSQKAYLYGITMPKGILLVGIQGTGKSLSAKTISSQWKLPLFRLDVSKIFTGILGTSENRMEKIINTCINNSPCILWIDEIDKVFNDYNSHDSGTQQRVTNIFLTWLSEKKEKVFVVATANTINKLPIELLRKGRFDEIFFMDLPNFKERLKIFQIHIKKLRPVTWNRYNIYYLSKITKGFSGAEIEQSTLEGMYRAFYEEREFTTMDIKHSILNMIPLSKTEHDKILKLRKWGYSGKIKIA
uniref:Uncharacterized AAA domain-containing protein ycf46 n=1 Tax=Dipterosiphonia australica TaxID=2007208 RepID=A0A1Z1MLK5_9FLOR|nr:hypothetical protein [Dipterosiphonia australica]ARW66732.1 hypothetical protein [Dipterosiphonia australica]